MKAQELINNAKQQISDDDFVYTFHPDEFNKFCDQFEKELLTNFLDFLLKEGYCDTDVYAEPSTAIDQYLIFDKK